MSVRVVAGLGVYAALTTRLHGRRNRRCRYAATCSTCSTKVVSGTSYPLSYPLLVAFQLSASAPVATYPPKSFGIRELLIKAALLAKTVA